MKNLKVCMTFKKCLISLIIIDFLKIGWFKIGQDEKYPASHIALMVISVVSATVGTIATSMWIKLVISSKISMAGTYISRFRVYGTMVALTCSLLKKGTKLSKGESTNFKRLYSNICFPRFS